MMDASVVKRFVGAAIVAVVFGIGGCSDDSNPGSPEEPPPPGTYSTFTDSRDGKTYKIVTMPDGKTWMAENLNYMNSSWSNGVSGSVSVTTKASWCYDNQADSCAKYGRLYTWLAAKEACPSGWRLPDTSDWGALERAVGGSSIAGRHLKSTYGWYDGGNGDDTYGFSALPGGGRTYSGGISISAGDYGYWWTATEYSAGYAYYRYMGFNIENVGSDDDGKRGGSSARCIRD